MKLNCEGGVNEDGSLNTFGKVEVGVGLVAGLIIGAIIGVDEVIAVGIVAEEVVGSLEVVEETSEVEEGAEGVRKISVNDAPCNESSVDKLFSKHSSDFGEYPEGFNSSKTLYKNELKTFIDNLNNIQKGRTYRGQPETYIYDEESHLWTYINE